jgi:hypothetical protein
MNLTGLKMRFFDIIILFLFIGAIGILFIGCTKPNGIIIDKAWLDTNLGGDDKSINTQAPEDPTNPPVLFIAITQDSFLNTPVPLGANYNDYHIGKRDVDNNILWEAVKVPWPWENRSPEPPHHLPDFVLYTMKGSASLNWDYGDPNIDNDGTCTKVEPGFLSQADPDSVAWIFEELGITHGVPSDPRNDIDLIIYIQQKYNHDVLYTGYLYWLLEFYGYPPERIHILDGGLSKWGKDGGSVIQKSTGPTISYGTFIPEVREDIFADKTLVQAISSGKVHGAILDIRSPYNPREPLLAGGISQWSIEPNWYDPLQNYFIPGMEMLYEWKDSMDTTTGCSTFTTPCLWRRDTAGNIAINPDLEAFFTANNIGKNDPIILY